MMLKAILHELQTSSGPMTVRQLSHKLGVQESALEGMLRFLERKGQLVRDQGQGGARTLRLCGGKTCVFHCPGPDQCPLLLSPATTSYHKTPIPQKFPTHKSHTNKEI